MLKYAVDDIRLFYENDERFLKAVQVMGSGTKNRKHGTAGIFFESGSETFGRRSEDVLIYVTER